MTTPQEPDGIDPVRFEVMRHACVAAADEMAATLRRTAYSTNIKSRGDFSCALFDTQLRVIAQSFSQPVHLASMARLVPQAVQIYGAERLAPGDALVFNDPHAGSIHLNDVVVIAPYHVDDTCIGYGAVLAHHVDIGGMAPGGLCLSRDLYQEGLILPPTRLVVGGELDENVFGLILANLRSGRAVRGDFRAQLGAAWVGGRRMAELAARFGGAALQGFADALIAYTQRWTEQALRELPEGTWSAACVLDDDGVGGPPIELQVAVTLGGGRIAFDLAGCAAQRRAPMNANLTYTWSAMAYVAKCLVDPALPANEGFYAQIDVDAPPGSVVNAQPPAGVVGGNEVCMRLCDLGIRALAPALPDRVAACSKGVMCQMGCGGRGPDGEDYAFYETLAGGCGGRKDLDGMDAVQSHAHNTENAAVEETEQQYPIRIVRYALRPDSEGPGAARGGLGLRRDWQFVGHAATCTLFSDHRTHAPWGLFGGGDAAPAQYVLQPDTDEERELPSKITIDVPRDGVVSVRTPGGGGYGDPRARAPEAAARDVRDGKVSPQRARDVYAVVVDDDGVVDAAATEALRRELG